MTRELPNPLNGLHRKLMLRQLRQRMDEGIDTAIDVIAGVFPIILFVVATYFIGSLTVFWNAGL